MAIYVSAADALKLVRASYADANRPLFLIETAIFYAARAGELPALAAEYFLEKQGNGGQPLQPTIRTLNAPIPCDLWTRICELWTDRQIVIDWTTGEFGYLETTVHEGLPLFDPQRRVSLREHAYGVKFLKSALPGVSAKVADENNISVQSEKRPGGRPPEYDWEGALAHLIALANRPDGLHPTNEPNASYLAELMASWFEQTAGKEPASSELRKRGSVILRAIEKLKLPRT